jgi:hypothetical protein
MDVDAHIVRMKALQANLNRYGRLLATYLTDTERAFICRRIAEDKSALAAQIELLAGTADPGWSEQGVPIAVVHRQGPTRRSHSPEQLRSMTVS